MQLLHRIERYLRRSGVSATHFGRSATHDPRFVHDLRNGREPRPPMAARIGVFLDHAERELSS